MNVALLSSSKLHDLLTQLWRSPVFGTSYPSCVGAAHPAALRTIDEIYWQLLEALDQVLACAWPERCVSERDASIREVAAKSVAFCGAVAAGEITDVKRLRAAASAIALVSWTDQTMDRGDADMVRAVELVAGGGLPHPQAPSAAVQRYIDALGWFAREVEVLARPEDRPLVLRCLLDDTLAREARMRRLSERYGQMDPDRFWEQYAAEIGRLSVYDVGFVAVTAMVYAIYRQHDPELPTLAEVLANRALQVPLRAGCATIRALDDIGDREIDAGNSRWGIFTINLCNQADPRHLRAFLDAAGIDAPPLRGAMCAAWASGDDAELTAIWLDYVRDVYAGLPDQLWARYATFLQLSQRVIEAGLVNALGDDVLAEEPREREWGA